MGDTVDRLKLIRGYFNIPSSYEDAIGQLHPDTLMHFAWHGVRSGDRNDPDHVNGNVGGTVDLLKTAARCGCRTFIGAGSQAEYGPSRQILSEDSPTRPNTLYGAAKLATYFLGSQLANFYGIRFAWLRIFSVFGPQDDDKTLIGYVTTELLSRRSPAVSECQHLWDYLYVDDAAAAFVAVSKSTESGVINVASGDARSLRQTILQLRDVIDPSLPITFGGIPKPPDGPWPLLANVDKLRRTGWRPSTTTDVALGRTVAWYRSRLEGAP